MRNVPSASSLASSQSSNPESATDPSRNRDSECDGPEIPIPEVRLSAILCSLFRLFHYMNVHTQFMSLWTLSDIN